MSHSACFEGDSPVNKSGNLLEILLCKTPRGQSWSPHPQASWYEGGFVAWHSVLVGCNMS